jgi:hypothetical protein
LRKSGISRRLYGLRDGELDYSLSKEEQDPKNVEEVAETHEGGKLNFGV